MNMFGKLTLLVGVLLICQRYVLMQSTDSVLIATPNGEREPGRFTQEEPHDPNKSDATSADNHDNYTTFAERTGNNYTFAPTTEMVIPTLDPGLTLEDIKELIGPPGPACMKKASTEPILPVLRALLPDTSLSWTFCQCYEVFCPNQTEEELKIRTKEIVSDNKIIYDEYGITTIVTFGVVITIGTIGNILVMLVILIVLRPVNVTNMFIFSLSCADLLVCDICVPLRMHNYLLRNWLHGHEACQVIMYLYYALFMCSVFTLTAMSVERWFVICFPMKAQYVSTIGRTRVIIIVSWVAAFLLAMPAAFNANGEWAHCAIRTSLPTDWSDDLFIYIFVGVFCIPCCVMGFAYFHTSYILWQSLKITKQLKAGSQQNGDAKDTKNSSSNETRSRIQVIQMLISIWVIFVICWGPYLLFELLHTNARHTVDMSAKIYNHFYRALNLLTMANSCINPILYALMSRQFRKGFVALVTCKPLRTKRDVTTAISRTTGISSVSNTVKETTQ